MRYVDTNEARNVPLTMESTDCRVLVRPLMTNENLCLLTWIRHSLFWSTFWIDWVVCSPVRIGSWNIQWNGLRWVHYTLKIRDRACSAVVHGDCYITIMLHLQRTPAYPSPWNSACYIMITVDSSSTSMIRINLIVLVQPWSTVIVT